MKMREHFVIPEDEVYNTLALQRVNKCWRHYKHSLKLTFFKPNKLTEEEHYDIVPTGHTHSEWKPLVQYWFSLKVQEHFVIPEDEVYNTLALQRVNKCWRHYKHSLKLTFFKPNKLTEEEHYDIVPTGHTHSEWKPLVQYWFSLKVQQLSKLGKAARATQNQVHTLGSTS
ncbi:hypothetical protein BVRB_7g163990 [Beta vulgaris subsp. vulgaris]|nr:hypothetical protein BVRB_7g163990 [Beta vulgaris subsp. vulgaris]